MEEYFKVLLGGLFGIATIVVAVLSLTSNIINGKCFGSKQNYKAIYQNARIIYPTGCK